MITAASKYIAIFALTSIAVMAVFGLILMDASMTGHSDCVAARAMGEPCPLSLADVAFHHISLFQIFATAIPAALLAAILAAVSIFFPLYDAFGFSPPLPFFFLRPIAPDSLVYARRMFLRWLSIFEHSPSI